MKKRTNKLGFTLIELLAVIVILAIITLIAIPIVMNIISDAKISANDRSVENYIRAVELAIVNYQTKNSLVPTTFEIIEEGKSIKSGDVTIPINYNGTSLTSGTIIFDSKNNIILRNGLIKESDRIYSTSNGTTTSLNESNGLYAEGNGRYIYKGADPDNYIWLDENGDNVKTDEELYRIISYESDGTIKVIRNERIINPNPKKDEVQYTFSWDTRDVVTGTRQNDTNSYCNYNAGNIETYYGCNAWGNQTNTYFQGNLLGTNFYYKYYANNTATTLSQSPRNLTVENNATLNNYLNNTWLDSNLNLNNHITTHNFSVGGPMYYGTYTGGDQEIEKEKEQEDLSAWNGKVGLMNITEYIDASLDKSCTSVYNSFYYNPKYYYDENGDGVKTQNNTANDWPCKSENYLYKSTYSQWSLSANSGNLAGVWYIFSTGSLFGDSARVGNAVRPAFYLKSTINLNGVGTILDPYKVS